MAKSADGSMTLGEHLDELRSRLIKVLIVLGVTMISTFAFIGKLQPALLEPLIRATELIDDQTVRDLGHETRESLRTLWNRGPIDGPLILLKISLLTGLAVAFPFLIYQMWAFVLPGLRRNERKAGFVLVPLAVVFFYGGLVFGYLLGLPYLYMLLFEFNVTWNPGVHMQIFQSDYYGFFFAMCLLFGIIMDIPWAILVLVQAGFVTPQQLAQKRKMFVIIAVLVAAVLTPPDPFSQMIVFSMMVVLFEFGLLLSRLVFRRQKRSALSAAQIGETGLIGHMVELPDDPQARVEEDELPSSDCDSDEGVLLTSSGHETREVGDDEEPAEEGHVPDRDEVVSEEQSVDVDETVDEDADPWSRGRPRRDVGHQPEVDDDDEREGDDDER